MSDPLMMQVLQGFSKRFDNLFAGIFINFLFYVR